MKGICTESRVVDMPNLWNATKSVEIQSIAFQDVCIEIYVRCNTGYTKVYSTSVLLYIYIYYIYIYLYYIFVYARKSSDMMHKIECVKCVTLHKIPHVGKIYMFVYTHSTCVSCVVYILSTYFIQVKFVILADQDS